MELSIGFSPCPNDTFIFDAMVNGKIDTGDFVFKVFLEDVETLNRWALEGKLDITKLSFPAFFQSLNEYVLMDSGSALGEGVGPLLVSREETKPGRSVDDSLVALPGMNTTAHLLFNFAYPNATHKKFMIFSSIEDAVLAGEAEFGVIIHENRFTYAEKGLRKITDLGTYWEKNMKVPVPLGGIAAHRRLEEYTAKEINALIRQSLEFAFTNYPAIPSYVKTHSQAMSEDVMRQHIDLYVNKYSLDLGTYGKNAIQTLHEVFKKGSNTGISSPGLFLT